MATVTDLELQNFIGGEFVDAPEYEDVINPSTGEVIARAPVSSADDVDRAVKAARKAFETWGVSTPRSRSEALLALADAILEHGDEFSDIESAEEIVVHDANLSRKVARMLYRVRALGEDDRLLLVNLGRQLDLAGAAEPLLGPPAGRRWRILWSS